MGIVEAVVFSATAPEICELLLLGSKFPWLATVVPWAVSDQRPELIADLLGDIRTMPIGLDLLYELRLGEQWCGTDEAFDDALHQRLWLDALSVVEESVRQGKAVSVGPVLVALLAAMRRREQRPGNNPSLRQRARLAAWRLQSLENAITGWERGAWFEQHAEVFGRTDGLKIRHCTPVGLPRLELAYDLWLVQSLSSSSLRAKANSLQVAERILRNYVKAIDCELEPGPAEIRAIHWLPSYERLPAGPWAEVLLTIDVEGKGDELLRPVEFEERLVLAFENHDRLNFHILRVSWRFKIRLQVRLLLEMHGQLQELPQVLPAVPTFLQKVEDELVLLLKVHCKDVPAEGVVSIFAQVAEWPDPRGEELPEPLLPLAIAFVNQLPAGERAEIVDAHARSQTDAAILMTMLVELSAESDRNRVRQRIKQLRSPRILTEMYLVPHIQRQIAALMNAGCLREAEALFNQADPNIHDGYREEWNRWVAEVRMAMWLKTGDTEALRKYDGPDFGDPAEQSHFERLKHYFDTASKVEVDARGALEELIRLESEFGHRVDYGHIRMIAALRTGHSVEKDPDEHVRVVLPTLQWASQQPKERRIRWLAHELTCAARIDYIHYINMLRSEFDGLAMLEPDVVSTMMLLVADYDDLPTARQLFEMAVAHHGNVEGTSLHDSAVQLGLVSTPSPEDSARQQILFLSANPEFDERDSLEHDRLQFCYEIESFEKVFPTRAQLNICNEVSVTQLTALVRVGALAVHLGSHGRQGELCWEGDDAGLVIIGADKLREIFAGTSIVLVVLSACESDGLAKELAGEVPFAIGFSGQPELRVLKQFYPEFYGRLGRGETIRVAFDEAKNGVKDWRGATPWLHTANDVTDRPLFE